MKSPADDVAFDSVLDADAYFLDDFYVLHLFEEGRPRASGRLRGGFNLGGWLSVAWYDLLLGTVGRHAIPESELVLGLGTLLSLAEGLYYKVREVTRALVDLDREYLREKDLVLRAL